MKYLLGFIVAFLIMAALFFLNVNEWLNGWLSCIAFNEATEIWEESHKNSSNVMH